MILTGFKTQNKPKINFSHIILILTIETVTLGYSVEAIRIKCTNTDDFYFTSPGSNCNTYYKCTSKGQKEVLNCSRGMKFDFYKQSCSHSPGKCVEPSCIGRPNGIYQDTSHACLRYFTCFAGQTTRVDNCPSKQMYNGQKCVDQDQVVCNAEPSIASLMSLSNDKRCANLQDGLHSIGDNCNEYISCINGEVIDKRNCAKDYAFDAKTQQCIPKHLVRGCGNHLNTEDLLCQNKVDGTISDPTSKDCTMYIMCKAGKFEGKRQCSNQAVFNGESCVPSPLHECSLSKRHADLRVLDQCYRKSNGYYAYPQHGCTAYMRCIRERMVEVGLCSTGQYFDMVTGRCIYEHNLERRSCFESGISKDCENRIDGYYTDAKCDAFYYCHLGYKTEYKCRTGKVFNGQTCVEKSEHYCPKTDSDPFCIFRSDGYYKDANDGCRAYAYCSNGRKITYLCAAGHQFNIQSRKCIRTNGNDSNDDCNSDFECYGKSDGYHVDLKSYCKNYIFCNNYEKITQITCRDGKVFNGQKCVHPTEFDCPSLYNRRQNNCVPRNCLKSCEKNGFYIDLSSGCRDFHICINGKSSKASCQDGMRFNGEICVAEDKFTCPSVCTHNNEIGKECPLVGYIA